MEDSYVLVTVLRLTQLIFTIVITIITGYLLNDTSPNAPDSVKACVNFLAFICILNWIVSIYGLASRYIQLLAIPIIQLPLDIAGTLFSLVGAIVISVKLGTVDCPNWTGDEKKYLSWIAYWTKKLVDDQDPEHVISRCRTFQADNAFMYMLFITGGVLLFFTYRAWRHSGSRSNSGGFV